MAQAVHEALGFVETQGLVAALEAADAMLKSARVSLMGIERTDAAMMTVQVSGETAAVQAAVDAGTAAAKRIGHVVSSHVIARPTQDVWDMQQAEAAPSRSSSNLAVENMTVHELRTLARTLENLPIQGREIARANKQQLIDAIRDSK
jgi:ethanolamine utilization protein EutM